MLMNGYFFDKMHNTKSGYLNKQQHSSITYVCYKKGFSCKNGKCLVQDGKAQSTTLNTL